MQIKTLFCYRWTFNTQKDPVEPELLLIKQAKLYAYVSFLSTVTWVLQFMKAQLVSQSACQLTVGAAFQADVCLPSLWNAILWCKHHSSGLQAEKYIAGITSHPFYLQLSVSRSFLTVCRHMITNHVTSTCPSFSTCDNQGDNLGSSE